MHLNIYRGDAVWLDIYGDLASRQPDLGFDQTPEWFEAYVSHVVPESGGAMMIGVMNGDTGEPLLAMPMLLSVPKRLQIRYLSALSNYYTSLFQPIFLGGEKARGGAVSFFVSVLGNGALEWDELMLEPLAGEHSFFKVLCRSLDASRYPYVVDECFVNWYLEVGGRSYEAYEQSLPSKLKNTFRRKQRKLARELGYTICIAQKDDDLDDFISDYESVYQKSWKSQEGHPQFIRSIIKSFARKGWLRLGLMYIAEKPVAAQLWFVKDGVASIYKLSYDGQYAKYSVGSILTAAMMRQVIDDDCVELVDFLTGDDAYKKDWMSHQQARYRIRIYNKHSWRGQMLALWNMKIKPLLGKS